MIQNGRKSAFSRTVVKPERARVPLVPPAHLNDEERTFLLDLLKDAAPEQFIPTDMPILASYAEACIAARRAKQAGDWDALEKLTNVQCRLGIRLRIVPSTRIGKRKNAVMARNHVAEIAIPKSPWDQ